MTPQFANNTVRFVQVASAFAKRASEELTGHRTAKAAAEVKISPLVDLMLAKGVIGDNEKQAATAKLATQAGTLDLLKNAVDKIALLKAEAVKTAGELGQPGDLEAAGGRYDPQNSLTSPFVGQRTSTKKASDVAIFKGLGLPV